MHFFPIFLLALLSLDDQKTTPTTTTTYTCRLSSIMAWLASLSVNDLDEIPFFSIAPITQSTFTRNLRPRIQPKKLYLATSTMYFYTSLEF